MAIIRRWHSYIGLFIAPSVLFFALTGAAQLFSLHEAHGSYLPPAIVERLSSVHKDQVFALGHHHELQEPGAESKKPEGNPPEAATEDEDKPALSTLTLKAFFLLIALCLVLSTGFGLCMGLTQTRQKHIAWILVLAGTLIPVGLLLI